MGLAGVIASCKAVGRYSHAALRNIAKLFDPAALRIVSNVTSGAINAMCWGQLAARERAAAARYQWVMRMRTDAVYRRPLVPYIDPRRQAPLLSVACVRGLQLFFKYLLQQFFAEHLVRQHPLEPGVLRLQLLHAAQI